MLSYVFSKFNAIWEWQEKALWRSWLVHLAGAVLIAILAGGRAVFTGFAMREAEQLFHARRTNQYEPWYDYIMDLVGPALVWWLWPY